MKNIFLTTFLFAASLTLVGCDVLEKDAYDYMEEVKSTDLSNESINSISLGDPLEKIEIGKPKRKEQDESIVHLTYGNDGLLIILNNNQVIEYQINNNQYRTEKGIKIGSSKDEIVKVYGPNHYKNREDEAFANLGYFDKELDRHIEFTLKNDQVITIKVVDMS